jgi:hypothetical protein
MRYILLILASSCSLWAAQVVLPQPNRPYNTPSYGYQSPHQQLQQPYYDGQIQTYGQLQPYYNPYYTPYEPENGPMRGPNSIEGHQYAPYHPQ